MELRCASGILHGILDEGVIEFRCRSNRCGHEPGVVVIHGFDVLTGEIVKTSVFAEPNTGRSKANADRILRSAVRSA